MKKFFALMLSVAMLLVAGSAMAANPTITLSATTATVQAGGTEVTVRATAAKANSGDLGAISVSGAEWATIDNGTVTLAPAADVAAGSYPITLSVKEVYADAAAGHAVRTATGTATLNVTVTKATAGTKVITKIVEVVTTVTKTVKVISTKAAGAAVVHTFTQVVRTVVETVTTEVLTEEGGYTRAIATFWSAKATVVKAAIDAGVKAITGNVERAKSLFNMPGLTAEQLIPQDNSALVSVTSTITVTKTITETLSVATAELSKAGIKNAVALSAQEAVKATKTGTYSFVKTFKKELYGTKIKGHNGKRARSSVSGSFAAAAEGEGEGVVFLNSAGQSVDVIPDDKKSMDIMPGYVTMLVVMEAGQTYEPVVYATEDALKAMSIDVSDNSVTYDEITEKEETVIVTVDENGNVTETVDEEAPAEVETKMKSVLANIKKVPVTSYDTVSAADIAADDKLAASSDLHVLTRMPYLKDLADGEYYVPATFAALPSGRQLLLDTDFVFYPDGIKEGTTAFLVVFDESGDVVARSSISSIFGKTGYVGFEISGGEIRTANKDNSLANPTVTLQMVASEGHGTESEDVEIARLKTKGYIDSRNVLQNAAYLSGTKPTSSLSGDIYTIVVALKDDFKVDNWSASVQGTPLTVKSSAPTGTVAVESDTKATITVSKSSLPYSDTNTLTLSLHPTSADASARVTATWNLPGNSDQPSNPEYGVGSSSGGCSAGSAVLALAVLGAFIASRKK